MPLWPMKCSSAISWPEALIRCRLRDAQLRLTRRHQARSNEVEPQAAQILHGGRVCNLPETVLQAAAAGAKAPAAGAKAPAGGGDKKK